MVRGVDAVDLLVAARNHCAVLYAEVSDRGIQYVVDLAGGILRRESVLALIRKKGKLPCETVSQEYSLEYGTAVIEMHKTSIKPGQKVLIVDDLIATGGTTQAMISLVERLGGEVAGVLVLIELAGLKGREAIAGYRLDSAIVYEGK